MSSSGRELIVLATDHPAPGVEIEKEVLARVAARLVVAKTGAEEELLNLAPEAEAILTCFARVTPDVVRAATRLRVIGRYGVGVDNIAVETATERDVIVANVPAYCVDEVAEHALALLFTLARRINRYDRAVRVGNWELSTGMPLHRLRGKSLGIVGLGRIGRALAVRGKALGMKVLAVGHAGASAGQEDGEIQWVGLDELFSSADFISIHTPLTAQTTLLVDARRIALMKSTAILINTSRGGVVDLVALESALRSGAIAGAGLDVFDPERLPLGHPLLALDNFVATPHVAFYSEESIGELEALAAANVADVLSGYAPPSVVNPEVLQRPRWVGLRPSRRTATSW